MNGKPDTFLSVVHKKNLGKEHETPQGVICNSQAAGRLATRSKNNGYETNWFSRIVHALFELANLCIFFKPIRQKKIFFFKKIDN